MLLLLIHSQTRVSVIFPKQRLGRPTKISHCVMACPVIFLQSHQSLHGRCFMTDTVSWCHCRSVGISPSFKIHFGFWKISDVAWYTGGRVCIYGMLALDIQSIIFICHTSRSALVVSLYALSGNHSKICGHDSI